MESSESARVTSSGEAAVTFGGRNFKTSRSQECFEILPLVERDVGEDWRGERKLYHRGVRRDAEQVRGAFQE